MKRKNISEFLVILLLLGLTISPLSNTKSYAESINKSGKCGDSISWTLTGPEDSLTLMLSGFGSMENFYEAPWDQWSHSIKKIVLSDGITTIGNNAFKNTDITLIQLPSTLKSIGNTSFFNTLLIDIDLPNSLESIGSWAFGNCKSLNTIVVPDTVSFIDEDAFVDCTNLTKAILPTNLENISYGIFSDCEKLSEVIMPKNLKRIEKRAFYNCAWLSKLEIPDSVEEIGQTAFEGCKSLETISLPSKLKEVASSTFEGCEKLGPSVLIPQNVENVESDAFNGCTSITSVHIPKSVKYFGMYVFRYNDSITDIYYQGGKSDWEKIRVEYGNSWIDKANIHFNSYGGVNQNQNNGFSTSFTAYYQDGATKKECSQSVRYSDDMFYNAEIGESQDLARLSVVAASAAYKKKYIKRFLSKCKFANLQEVYSAKYAKKKEDRVDKPSKKSNDHVKVYYAVRKNVSFDNGKGSLIAIIIKGTSNDPEWISNFNLGKGGTHKGFSIATKEVVKGLKNYIKQKKIKAKNKRFWITGHSRGAGVANLVAEELTTQYKTNVYAYTYASPRVSQYGSEIGYPNVINYLNPGDFVTEVAPYKEGTEWNYKRYGKDIVLPESSKESMMQSFYSKIGVKYQGFTQKEKETLVDKFIDYVGPKISDYNTMRTYVTNVKGVPVILKFKPVHFFKNGLGCFMSKTGLFSEKGMGFVDKDGDGLSKALAIAAVDSKAAAVLVEMAADQVINPKFGHAHTQESYVSWIDAMY